VWDLHLSHGQAHSGLALRVEGARKGVPTIHRRQLERVWPHLATRQGRTGGTGVGFRAVRCVGVRLLDIGVRSEV